MVLVGFRHPGYAPSFGQGGNLNMERDSIRENRGSSIKAARIRALASKGRYGEEEDDRARCAVTKASLGWGRSIWWQRGEGKGNEITEGGGRDV